MGEFCGSKQGLKPAKFCASCAKENETKCFMCKQSLNRKVGVEAQLCSEHASFNNNSCWLLNSITPNCSNCSSKIGPGHKYDVDVCVYCSKRGCVQKKN